MPTYEYLCNECEHKFSRFQSIKEDPIEECEKCGGKVRKLFGATGLIFKGSGFYVNDYKKGGASDSKSPSSSETPSCGADKSNPACEGCSHAAG